MKIEYETYLEALHSDAAREVADMLSGLEKNVFSEKGQDHRLLMTFELIRQLAHQTTKSPFGTGDMIELILNEVLEIRKEIDEPDDVSLAEYRSEKNKQLEYLGPTFLAFAVQERYGTYPEDGPDFRTEEQIAWDEAKEELFREAAANQVSTNDFSDAMVAEHGQLRLCPWTRRHQSARINLSRIRH